MKCETRTAYKLMRLRRDGTLGSLFIGKKQVIPIGEWLKAESKPTGGFALRPGWHTTDKCEAPHLSPKGRVWCLVEIADYTEFTRPRSQGSKWLLANWMRVVSQIPQNVPIPTEAV